MKKVSPNNYLYEKELHFKSTTQWMQYTFYEIFYAKFRVFKEH